MKALTTVAMYGLVPLPSMQGAQALGDDDDQPPRAEDSNAALLAWYRHLAASDEIARARLEREGLEADLSAQGDSPLSMSRDDASERACAARS
jgi:hypothetical protein